MKLRIITILGLSVILLSGCTALKQFAKDVLDNTHGVVTNGVNAATYPIVK